ncbi:MAG: tetratricopeptide repeat protein [Patescibacteria group bacterium]
MDLNQRVSVNVREGEGKSGSFGVPFGISRKYEPNAAGVQGAQNTEKNQKIVKILDFIIKISLFAIFFGIPLFFTNLSYQGIAFEKQIYFYFWILLALVAWGSKGGYVGEMKIRRTPLDLPIIGFWIFYLLATIFSVDQWHSFTGFFGDPSRGFISITAMVVVYYLILSNFNENLSKWLMKATVFSGIIALVWELMKIFNLRLFIPQSIWDNLPINTIGSLQSFAVYACFLVFIFMTAILKLQNDDSICLMKKRIYSFLYFVLIAASLLAILVLYNYLPIFRSFPMIGLVVGSAFFLIFVLAKIVRPKEAWGLFPMVVFIIILAFLMIGSVNISSVNLPFNVSIPYPTVMHIARESIQNNFFIGYGPGNFGYAFSKFLPANFDNMNLRFFEGEGIIFESISTIGAIGTALLMIAILTFLGTSIFLLYREKEKNKLYSLGILTATIVILINVITSQAEAAIVILLVIMSALSAGILFAESNVKEKFINFSLKTSPKFALTLAFISLLIFASVAFLFVFFGKIYIADLYMGKAVRSEKVSEEGSISKIGKALQLNSREGRYFARLGQEYLVLTNEEMLKGENERDVNKIQAYLSTGVQAGIMGRDLMKNDVTAIETLAQIYENSGIYLLEGLDLAEKEYQRALELEPNNPNFYMRLGQIKNRVAATKESKEEKKKLVEEGRDLFNKALEVRNNYDPAYYNLALSEEALGDLDKAIEDMTKAAMIQRNNINYVFNLARMLQSRGKDDDNKTAESLFKEILGVNDKEINTHFNLGLLYEKTNRKSEAISEYQKVIDLLPEGSDDTKNQLEKMISNIKKGVENTPENLGLTNNQNGNPADNSGGGNADQSQNPGQ